jgi:glucose-6-phosphate isomerase
VVAVRWRGDSELPFAAGEVNFGEPGTNGQHSFYQLIHQGQVVPCDFIGFVESQTPVSLAGEVRSLAPCAVHRVPCTVPCVSAADDDVVLVSQEVSNHDELMSNFFAQPDALANGKSLEEVLSEGVKPHLAPHKVFPGNRPSSSMLFQRLNAYTTGQLLSLYEHRTAVQVRCGGTALPLA